METAIFWLVLGLYLLVGNLCLFQLLDRVERRRERRGADLSTPVEPARSMAATVRDALVDTIRTKRPYVVADDLHQARAERQAHQAGAPLKPPPRYR